VAGVLAVTAPIAGCGDDEEESATPTGVVDGGEAVGAGADSGEGATVAELLADGGSVVVANSPGALSTNGPQRLLVALIAGGSGELLGGEDVPATVVLTAPDGEVASETEAEWLATPGAPLGMYLAHVEFPTAGSWEVNVAGNEQPGFQVEVGDDSSVPEVGDEAPRSETPTASTPAEVEEISTDPEPVAAFYQQTVADAVTSGRPTMVVFATPAFCKSATCGPTVELVKEVATDHPDVNVVHVEPYDIEQARNGVLESEPVLDEWGLVTEPWVFVVDGDGLVSASFEGLVGSAELDQALDSL
jgi:hypothetical protein